MNTQRPATDISADQYAPVAAVTAALVRPHDVIGTAVAILTSAADTVGASAGYRRRWQSAR